MRWAREAAKWGADFMAKSVEENRVLLHIGDIQKDHGYIGRGEDYPSIDRNIRFCASGALPSVFRHHAWRLSVRQQQYVGVSVQHQEHCSIDSRAFAGAPLLECSVAILGYDCELYRLP